MTNEEAMTVLRGLLAWTKKQHTTKRAKMQRMIDAGKTPSASMRADVERAEYTVQQATAAVGHLYALLEAPAAARGDVRGLVALAEQMERDAAGCRRDGYTDAAVVKEDCAQRIRQTLGISAIAEALAAEGVQCETCNGASVIVTYVDPYERGDVSSPEQSPCPDCAEGVQAGEVGQRARELLAAELRADLRPGAAEEAESGKLDHDPAMRAIVAALSQQPEARGVVGGFEAWARKQMAGHGPIKTVSGKDVYSLLLPPVERDAGVDAAILAALTGARNG